MYDLERLGTDRYEYPVGVGFSLRVADRFDAFFELDELGHLPLERRRAHVFFPLVICSTGGRCAPRYRQPAGTEAGGRNIQPSHSTPTTRTRTLTCPLRVSVPRPTSRTGRPLLSSRPVDVAVSTGRR